MTTPLWIFVGLWFLALLFLLAAHFAEDEFGATGFAIILMICGACSWVCALVTIWPAS